MDEPVMLCFPVSDAERQALRDIVRPLPAVYAGSVTGRCAGCGMQVWIGPRQQLAQLVQPMKILCVLCVVKQSDVADVDVFSLENPESRFEDD